MLILNKIYKKTKMKKTVSSFQIYMKNNQGFNKDQKPVKCKIKIFQTYV